MHETEEVFDVVFPSGDKSSEVVQPCEEPFDCIHPGKYMLFRVDLICLT